ncbi:hypothetical protein [Tabrizicola sp.]|uniref:hypothetical protein n=1 Tax=Tabrizicola sp. TaxID=2005166 RepID=UPI00273264D0|nr:hypothetical protein [Tabrizicola sp.]MDP3197507.1 hypothetical protein [Tabrizicola sp.]
MLPILARLQSLQAAARFVPGGGRVISEATDRNPVAQLLRVVNETMLARSLRFVSSAGPSLTLDVAGRRILRVTDAEGLIGAESCLGTEVLEDEHKDDLIKLFQGVAVLRHELHVVSGPVGRGGEEVSVGLPVALLADLLLVDLNVTEPDDDPVEVPEVVVPPTPQEIAAGETGLSGFAAAMGPALIAWLIDGGAENGRTDGPDEMVSHLQGFLADERDSLERQFDLLSAAPGDAICMILGAMLVEGHSIVGARIGPAMLLGVIEGDATTSTLGAWKTALR